jgi:tetratricopeptide (TPR) repeat protein
LSEARFNLGCLWLTQNKPEAAKAEFTAYTLHWPKAPEGYLKLGAAQLRTREPSAAEKSFNEALRLSPQNAEALNGLGLARLARGQTGEAAQYFQSALKQQPGYRPALLNLAIVAHQYLRDRPLALQKYREYLALKPPPANADALAATVRQLEQELNPPVRRAVTNATPLASPATPPAKPVATNVARVASAPKPEPASNAPKAAPTHLPKPIPTNVAKPAPVVATPAATNVEVVKLAAEPVLKQGQEVAVAPAPKQAPPVQPLVPAASAGASAAEPKAAKRGFFESINPLNLFRSREKPPMRPTPLGPAPSAAAREPAKPSTAAAEPVAAGAAAPVPTGPPGRYAYQPPARPVTGDRAAAERLFAQGVQAYQAHRLAEAIQAYRSAVKLDPSLFEAHYNLGLAAAEAGNLPLALTAYEAALALRPGSVDARYNFALVLKQTNHPVDAADELERIVTSYPNETRAHLALGNLYAQQLDQPGKARQHYLKVLEIEPRHPQASAIHFWLAANPP